MIPINPLNLLSQLITLALIQENYDFYYASQYDVINFFYLTGGTENIL